MRETGEEHVETKLITALPGRDMLLVVDNMEHLLDATGDLVRLITELPRLQLLVTSRSPLRVRAERTFELGPLEVPDADASPGGCRWRERGGAVRRARRRRSTPRSG